MGKLSRMNPTRRRFLASTLGAAAGHLGCGPSRHQALRAYAFVANSEGQTVAVADLATFAVARQIRLDDQPSQVIAPASRRSSVYVLTPASGSVHEIAVEQLKVQRKLRVGATAVSMQLDADGNSIYVLLANPKKLVRIALDRFVLDWEIALPAAAVDFDLGNYTDESVHYLGAVSYGSSGAFAFFDPAARKLFPAIQLGGEAGAVRFQYGKELIVANLSSSSLSVYNSLLQRRMVELPLKTRPDHLCFNKDAGHLFVTGQGSDAVSVVYPYRTPEVAETVLAGRQPGAMAVSEEPAYLFVSSPGSGDVSILNMDHKLMAVVSVGSEPCFITTTPNSDFALVLNRKSGDMAVLRIDKITRNRLKSASLFTIIPVGSAPISAAVQMI